MKNLNLIKRLWTDSHEKQSPQRFTRYAAILIMLLTIGVGEIRAWNFGDDYGRKDVTIWFDNSATQLSNIKIYFENGSYSQDYSFSPIAGTDYWTITTHYAGYNKYEIHGTPNNSSDNWGWKTNAKGDGEEVYSGWYARCFSPSTTSGQAGSWTVPGQKSVSYTRNSTTTANTLAGSGTSGSPYIIKPGTAIGVELSGTAIDASCTKYYKFGSSTASTTNTKQVVASCVAGTSYSMQGYTGAKRGDFESRYASAGTLYFKAAYTISAAVSGENGSVSITSGGNYVYTGNTSFTVEASPDDGYEVDTWTVTGGTKTGSGNSITVSASNSANCTVTVTFRAIPLEPYVTLAATKTTGINVGETITITATAHNTSATNYDFKEGSTSKQNSAFATFSYTPTTVGNKTINVVMTYAGGTKEASINLTLNTPSVALAIKTGSANNFYLGEGSTILKATPSNVGAGVTPSYVFTDQIVGGVTSSSQTETEWTYNPSVSGQAKARTMKVTMSVGGSTYTATVGVSVYEHFTVHIKNTDSWSGMYVYMWNASGNNGAFPGVVQSLWNGSDLIYNVVLDTKYTNFIISQGNDDKKSGDISMLAVSNAGNCYTTTTGTSLPAMTCPAVPSVTTTAASAILNTSATLGCHITNLNRDNASEYGYYYSTNSSLSSANATTVGTEVKIGGRKTTTGNNSKSQTGLSANTTYYVIAYAKNCAGTGWGSTVNFTTLSQTTVSFNTHGGSAVSNVTAVKTQAMPAISAPTRTGYTFNGMYDAASEGTQYYTSAGASACAWDKNDAEFTLHAQWTPKTYSITLDQEGGASGSTSVTMTYDASTHTAITNPTKTGYTFGGYWTGDNGTGTLVIATDGTLQAGVSTYTGAGGIWIKDATCTLYAKWTAKMTTITLDQTGAASTCSVTTRTGTYDADMPAITGSGSLPTAPQGYAFMGYYDALEPLGTKYYNADGTSAHTWDKEDASFTLHAYFKKAEITALRLSETVIAPNETITVTPTIEPTPVGPTKVCYELQYSNGTALPSQRTFTPGEGNDVSFPVPSASATYRIQAKLAKGSDCPADPEDVLSTRTTTFQVASAHTVTIRYQDSDGRTLQASASIEASPLNWTTDGNITPPTITGYTFARWDAGDGVSIKNGNSDPVTTTTTPSIQIKAVYDGTLTAVYNKKNMIFFNNTLGWSDVYVYFYSSDKYWVEDHIVGQGCGTGSNQNYEVDGTGTKAYYRGYHGHMTQIEGTNIWYYDYEAEHGAKDGGEIKGYDDVVFVETEQNNFDFFHNNKASRRGDFNHSLPMFVPINSVTETKNGTKYYSSGYWMNYPENTGYSLLIYNQKAKAGATKLYEFPFEFTGDFTMPMELVVDLEAGKTYGFEIKRADGKYYSNTGTMNANTTNWSMSEDQSSYCGLQTTAAGNYTFRFYYSSRDYRMDVTYPVAVNDYRIVYTDVATWSKDAHTASWSHPSRVITKNSSATETKKDTVSLFWSYGSTPAIKYQQCTGTGAGSVTWNAGTSIDVSGFSSVLTKKGVYNFIFEQPAGGASISLVGVEPYTGNYYIRTDCAGSTKWANFSSMDHQMTYSDYAEVNSGYSHYYTHWVTNGTNVKFCIANDYSMCITDTLVEDKGTVIANITAEGNDGAGRLNSASANIRFMWDQATNKISRAYIGGSTNISDRFLVLEGDSKMYDEDGSALNISGLNPNEANLIDVQNFVYERTIQVNTKARAKLTAKYNNNIQYFKGSEGAFAKGTTIELLGGDASGKHTMRIVYDFKTNRLVTAYVPSGTINANIAINADLMIVREHQGAGQQLLFEGAGKLSEVHTVYGVMRFNRWTLNNKEKTGGHSPVGDPKSIYERSLYWISFPFNVNLSDVFGFGTYGVDWIIEYYDGAERATNGYWIDSEGFWKMVMPAQRAAFTLEAGKGYVLAIDIDAMKDNNTTFWANNIEQVELFFPSATNVENITQTTAHTIVPEHECTIDRRTDKSVYDTNKDRTKADSHWNMIGVPSYANYNKELTDGSSTITWHDPETEDLPFLYEWNMTDDSYTVQSGSTYLFKAMHAYMVQYHGDLYWSLASATPTPSPIVARRAYAEKPQNAEFRLELQQNEKIVDQTFVNMKDAEEISAGFKFDEDLCKEFNAGKANIYTLIENYLPAAGNTLPMSEQTTLVPVGVKTTAAGEYTFAMPEGTNGVSVVLIDNIAGTRTNLALSDYTVALGKGDLSDRFMLEIAPIKQMPTDIENVQGDNVHSTKVRKVMIDGILYIVKDGKVFDARGAKVK